MAAFSAAAPGRQRSCRCRAAPSVGPVQQAATAGRPVGDGHAAHGRRTRSGNGRHAGCRAEPARVGEIRRKQSTDWPGCVRWPSARDRLDLLDRSTPRTRRQRPPTADQRTAAGIRPCPGGLHHQPDLGPHACRKVRPGEAVVAVTVGDVRPTWSGRPRARWWPRRAPAGNRLRLVLVPVDGRWRIADILPAGTDTGVPAGCRRPHQLHAAPATHAAASASEGCCHANPAALQHRRLHPLAGEQEFVGELAHDQPQRRCRHAEQRRPVQRRGQLAPQGVHVRGFRGADVHRAVKCRTSAGNRRRRRRPAG